MTYVPNWGHIGVKSRSARGARGWLVQVHSKHSMNGVYILYMVYIRCIYILHNTAVIGTHRKDRRLVPVGCKLEQTKNR